MLPPLTIAWNGQEQSLAALGYEQPRYSGRWNGGNTWSFTKSGGDPAAAADIPFEAQVSVYINRGGVAGNFQGGTRIFQGRRIRFRGRGDGNGRNSQLVLADALAYDLKQLPFQHFWYGTPVGGGAPVKTFFSRINLFQDINNTPLSTWAYLTSDQQIAQIIQFAAQQPAGNSRALLQVGTIDPVWNMPIYPVRGVHCLEALQIVLRSIPDAVMWIDYTTNDLNGNPLPTFNVTQRANCPKINLPYAWTDAAGRKHNVIDITPREDQVPASVTFQYQETNTNGALSSTIFPTDVYPPGASSIGLRAIVVPIDLRGASTKYVTGYVTSQAFDATSDAFWQRKKPDLAKPTVIKTLAQLVTDTSINDATKPNGIKIVDNQGNPVNLALFPYEMTDGSVAAWMNTQAQGQIKMIEATVKATASYTVNDERTATAGTPQGTRSSHAVDTHPISTNIRLTNSIPNVVAGQPTTYNTIGSSITPEIPPVGLAQNVYNSMLPLQYEFEHEMTEDAVSLFAGQLLGPQHVINLVGPGANAAWANMNAVVASVEIDFFEGRTRVSCGPFKHLSAQEFYDLLMMWRVRNVYDNPAIRTSGTDNGGAGTQLGQNTAKQDTNASSVPPLTLHSVASAPDANGHQILFQFDAGQQQMFHAQVDSTGTIVTTNMGSVRAALTDLPPGTQAKWQKISYNGPPPTCAPFHRYVFCTDETPGA